MDHQRIERASISTPNERRRPRMRRPRGEPRHEVVSVRLNTDRLALLQRYQQVLSNRLSRTVSIGEVIFLVIEDRVEQVERVTARQGFREAPTVSLSRIRQRWALESSLTAAEWDLLAEYVQIAADAARHEPPHVQPAIPSRESCGALLDIFDTLYRHRSTPMSPHVWGYVAGLSGCTTPAIGSGEALDQGHQALMIGIANQRELLKVADTWRYSGNLGSCVRTAIRQEGIGGALLDRLLAPYWSTLWGLAARGHWLRHGQPVRPVAAPDHLPRQSVSLQKTTARGDLSLWFSPSPDAEFTARIDFGKTRKVNYHIRRYPELVEFRAMLESAYDQSWSGRYFHAVVSDDQKPLVRTLRVTQESLSIDVSQTEWNGLRELFREAWQSPDVQWWLAMLGEQYGEQGG